MDNIICEIEEAAHNQGISPEDLLRKITDWSKKKWNTSDDLKKEVPVEEGGWDVPKMLISPCRNTSNYVTLCYVTLRYADRPLSIYLQEMKLIHTRKHKCVTTMLNQPKCIVISKCW